MREAVIVAGARTPVGKAKKGSLASVRPDDLGAIAVKETLRRAGGYEGPIDDLIIGCAMPEAEQGLNMARNIDALAGLPYTVPAITINRYCSSGLQSIAYGAERIMLGQAKAVLAGGAESMSFVPMFGNVARPNVQLVENAPEYYMGMRREAFLMWKIVLRLFHPIGQPNIIKFLLKKVKKYDYINRRYENLSGQKRSSNSC